MKQGTGKTTSAPMRQPKSKGIDPGAVSRLGNMQGPGTTLKPIVFLKGIMAPMVKQTNHKRGSQGEH